MNRETGGDDSFLRRWSRLKEEERARADEPAAPAEAASADPAATEGPPPELPPVETLGIDSDFRPFLHPKVEEHVRRTALKKLFTDPRFNVMDGLDVYIDDYSKTEPLTEAMLSQLEQAKKILAWSREDAEARAKKKEEADEQQLAQTPSREVAALAESSEAESARSPRDTQAQAAGTRAEPPPAAE